jgi:hypothetical protein
MGGTAATSTAATRVHGGTTAAARMPSATSTASKTAATAGGRNGQSQTRDEPGDRGRRERKSRDPFMHGNLPDGDVRFFSRR